MVKHLPMRKMIVIWLLLLLATPFLASAASAQHVYDDANLLTTEEMAALEKIAQTYSEKWETDFIIVTSSDADGKDVEVFMADTYNEQGFGYNQAHGDTVMFVIDMGMRDFYLSSFGASQEVLSNDRLNKVNDKVTPALVDGDYYGAFETFIKTSARYMGFKPGVNPDNLFYQTWFQAVIAAVIGAIVVSFMAYHAESRKTTTPRTYRNEQTTRIIKQHDLYVRTTTSRVRKPQNNSSSGGGSSGGGGGGGMTGGGSSYSGSRGSF